MKHHIKICAAKEGITYCFDNGNIISFQDNFKYLGDVPFAVYFDFEITIFSSKNVCCELLSNILFSSKSKSWKSCNLSEFSAQCRRNIWRKPFQTRTCCIFWQDNIFPAKRCHLCCGSTWKINLPRWIIFCWIKIHNRYINSFMTKANII